MLLSMQYLPGSRNGFMCRKLLNSKVILHSNMPNRCNINLLPSRVPSQMTPERCWQSRRTTIRYAISSLGFWFTWFLPHMPRDSDFSTDTFLFTLRPNQQASKESFTFFFCLLSTTFEQELITEVNVNLKSFTLLPSEIPEVDFKQKSKLCLRENSSKSKSSFTWHSLCCLQDVSAGMPSPPRLCALGRSWHGWGTSREEKREGKAEKMWGSHWSRVVTIHSEPSSCQTRGWSHHPALPRWANDENHTKGWSHSCPLRWGCPEEKAKKAQLRPWCVFNPKEKVLESRSQRLPAPSSSSIHHSVHQSKTKPGLNSDLHWCKAFLQALWIRPEVKEWWPWGWLSLLLSCVTATQPTTRPKLPRERIPAKPACGSGL